MNWLVEKARSLQLWSYRSLSKAEKKFPAVDIGQTIRSGKRILFCLPAAADFIGPATMMIERFSEKFPDREAVIFAFHAERVRQWFKSQQVVDIKPDVLNWYGRPKSLLLKNAAAQAYDLAVDLSIPFNFTSLALLWQVNAQLRIGFYEPSREPFYSLMFRPHPDTPTEKAYLEFFNLLMTLK